MIMIPKPKIAKTPKIRKIHFNKKGKNLFIGKNSKTQIIIMINDILWIFKRSSSLKLTPKTGR